jgi:hypothetical protein
LLESSACQHDALSPRTKAIQLNPCRRTIRAPGLKVRAPIACKAQTDYRTILTQTMVRQGIKTSTPPAPMPIRKARRNPWVLELLQIDPEVELMADQDPNQDGQDRNMEVPGDTNAADIVGRTGEQMPRQSHDGLEADERERNAKSTRVNDEDTDRVRDDARDSSSGSHDNPRTGRVSDW